MLRNAFRGQRRFDALQAALGVSRAVLAQRLARLVEEELLEKVRYQDHPPRYEYRLTEKGRAAWDVLAAMWRFGSDWLGAQGVRTPRLIDRESGAEVRPRVVDERTGEPLDPRRLRVRA